LNRWKQKVRQWSSDCLTVVTFTNKFRESKLHVRWLMIGREAVYFDPETVTLLRETLDDAWACLSPELQATMQKTALAERILKSAAHGERDRKRLRAAALDFAA
jgi:hypothetical protein